MGVCAVVGGQFGSEGKGHVVGRIAADYAHHVRVGAANAGHTLYVKPWDATGTAYQVDAPPVKRVMQQLPCAAYANPHAELWIGPGALISPDILENEAARLQHWRYMQDWPGLQIHVDKRAHVITGGHIKRERETDLAERIGSTSATAREGIGAAQAARVMREKGCRTAKMHYGDHDFLDLCDVPMRLGVVDSILLEGTQGAGLSLTTGPFPYVTSRNTTVAGLCADAGIAPNRIDRVILVIRSFPIRVAGSSGPFHRGSDEIKWEDIAVDPESERTTVTKKVRRVATFSLEQVIEAVILNGATEIALMFADYLDLRIQGSDSDAQGKWTSLEAYPAVRDVVDDIEMYTGVQVTYIGTGPGTMIELDRVRSAR